MTTRSHLGLRHRAFAVLLLALAGCYVPWTWSDQLADLGGDSAVYVLTARDFASGAQADPVAHAVAVESQFPPLYPSILSASGAANELTLAHLVTTICLLLAFVALWAWLSAIGLAAPTALAIVALFAVSRGTLLQALQIKSESLYLALSLAALAASARVVALERATLSAWIAAALCAAALLTRTAGVALLAGLAVTLAVKRPARWWLMPIVAALPATLWTLQRSGQASYGGTLSQLAAKPAAAIVQQLSANVVAIAQGLFANLAQDPRLMLLLVPVPVLAAVVLVTRLRAGTADAAYVAAYLAMLTIWPYPSEAARLTWVVVPVLLGYAALGGEQWASAAQRVALRWMIPLLLAVVVVPDFVSNMQRRMEAAAQAQSALAHLPEWYGSDPLDSRRQATAHLEMVQALGALGRDIPAGECVLSIKPVTVAFYTRHDGFAPPVEGADTATFEAGLRATRCQYLILMNATESPQFVSPYYPRDRVGSRLEVLAVEASPSDPRHSVVAALARLKR